MKGAKLAEDAQVSKQRVLAVAAENLRGQRLLEQTNAAYAALRANPEEVAALAEERARSTKVCWGIPCAMAPIPCRRGDVRQVDFVPARGHEQDGVRPAVVVSVDQFSNGPADVVAVLPITKRDRGIAAQRHTACSRAGSARKAAHASHLFSRPAC